MPFGRKTEPPKKVDPPHAHDPRSDLLPLSFTCSPKLLRLFLSVGFDEFTHTFASEPQQEGFVWGGTGSQQVRKDAKEQAPYVFQTELQMAVVADPAWPELVRERAWWKRVAVICTALFLLIIPQRYQCRQI